MHQSQLDATKRKLLISQEEEEATIGQQREIETARAKSQADVAEEQAEAERRREAARIARERDVRMAEIGRDRELRHRQLESELATETAKADNAVQLAAKRIEQAGAEAEAQRARAGEVEAAEQVETARDAAAAERDRRLALVRAAEQAEVDDTRVASEAGTLVSMARAQAEATLARANAEKDELLARAEGVAALIRAENTHSQDLIRLKLDRERIAALPGIVEKLVKPAEKIEAIRINQITGLGAAGGHDSGGVGDGDGASVNRVIDGILNLALQLPAARKLGEEVGLNIGGGVREITAALNTSGGDDGNEGTSPATEE